MGKRKKHKECATPECHNIVPYRSKRGATCGVCKRKLEEEKLVEETGRPDDGKLAQRLGKMRL